MICKRALWRWQEMSRRRPRAWMSWLACRPVPGASLSGLRDAALPHRRRGRELRQRLRFRDRPGQWVYVLTAAHVVGEDAPRCSANSGGDGPSIGAAGRQRDPPQRRQSTRRSSPCPRRRWAACLPSAIPLAPRGTAVRAGQTLVSVGCANGAWATGWKGHAVPGDADGELRFVPPPANGRSGSPILDAEGSRIVGVLVGAAPVDNAEGIGVPVAADLSRLRRDAAAAAAERSNRPRRSSASGSQLPTAQLSTPDAVRPNVPAALPAEVRRAAPVRQRVAEPGGPWPSLTPPAPSVN